MCCEQFEALAGFSAIIDRLGEFSEVVDSFASASTPSSSAAEGVAAPAAGANAKVDIGTAAAQIELIDLPGHGQARGGHAAPLLSLEHVTLRTPNGAMTLVEDLDLQVCPGFCYTMVALPSEPVKCCSRIGQERKLVVAMTPVTYA